MKKSDFKKQGVDFDEFKELFDLDNIDTFRELLQKMISKTNYYALIIEDLMQPDSISAMHEANFIRFKHLDTLHSTYKKIMKLNRILLLYQLNYKEDSFSKIAREFIVNWKKIKPDLEIIIRDMLNTWSKNVIHKTEGGYFG